MKVTRDVITDLLPLYLANEASADTRALVESFLQQNPEFSRLAKERAGQFLPTEIPSTLNPENEMKTLERTKRLLKIRSTLLGCSFFSPSSPSRSPSTRADFNGWSGRRIRLRPLSFWGLRGSSGPGTMR